MSDIIEAIFKGSWWEILIKVFFLVGIVTLPIRGFWWLITKLSPEGSKQTSQFGEKVKEHKVTENIFRIISIIVLCVFFIWLGWKIVVTTPKLYILGGIIILLLWEILVRLKK